MDNQKAHEIYNQKSKFLRTISISDIHFGKLNPEFEYNILNEQFISKIENYEFDILCIAGDLFHHKELANSDTIKYANLFVMKCLDICNNNGATLLLIHGTFEHDANQLKMFHALQTQNYDIRIIENAKFEYIKGYKILCLPEEYAKGKEYYSNFLDQSYDMCFMHGTYVGSIYGKNEVDLNSRREPVFDIKSFYNCKGPIISGHVHTAKCYNSHFYYHGSPIRSQFGEEENKGFYCTVYNKESRLYYIHFEEIISDLYNTYNIDNIIEDDINDIIKYIDNLSGDFIRIIISVNHSNIKLLKEYYKSNNKIKIETNSTIIKTNLTNNNTSQRLETEYDFIFDKNLSCYDILAKYINKNEGENFNITGKEIEECLNRLI